MSEKQIEESDKSIWVSNISPNTTEDELKHYFSKFGDIELAEIPEGKRFGRRQYAFIHFVDKASVEKAINEANGASLNDCLLVVKKAFKPHFDIESYRKQKEEEIKGGDASIPPRKIREVRSPGGERENYPHEERYVRRLPYDYGYRPVGDNHFMRRSANFDDYPRLPPDELRGPRRLMPRRADHMDPYYDGYRPMSRDPYYDRLPPREPYRELPPIDRRDQYESRPYGRNYRGLSRFSSLKAEEM